MVIFGGLVAFKREECSTVAVLCTVCFLVGVSEMLPYTVYAPEAERRGASATVYGLVFGTYSLVAFIVCPIWGKYVGKCGAAFLINGGLFLGGCSCIIFGLLHYVIQYTDFIVLSFIVTSMQALGSVTAQSTNRAIIGILFPKAIATTFAFVEGFYGIGSLVGPILAGFLFEVAGYACPFVVVGSLTLVSVIVIVFALPDVDDCLESRQPVEIFSLLKIAPVIVDMFCVITMNFGSGFYYSTLEPHLQPLMLSPVVIGTMLSTIGGFYVMSSHLVGRVCETRVNPKKVIVSGCLMGIAGFLLVGWGHYLHVKNALWIIYVGLALEGLCEAFVFVGAFIDVMRLAISNGLPDDITTYGIVSGTITSAYNLGGCLGPWTAGMLFDTVGFHYGTIVPITLHACVLIAMLIVICTTRHTAQKDGYAPLTDDKGRGQDDVRASSSKETNAHALADDDSLGVPAKLASITDVTSTSGYESNDSEAKHLLAEESR